MVNDVVQQHKDSCKEENCVSCTLPIDKCARWDEEMRGAALEKKFGGLDAKGIFELLDWKPSPPRIKVDPIRGVKRDSKAMELISNEKKKSAST